ncbi:helix-turn-helix domain-containing protein [Myroides injenensis]|uniref:helix-turn-helix domain-containing protein n=1 Tax=Myroides injenensis TaxID=1183151 RepID=UPI000288E7DE|nr:AraC family transcriptional regulator [Myroides injenensis]
MKQSVNRQELWKPRRNWSYEYDRILTEDNLVQEYRQIEARAFSLHFYKSNRTKEKETYVYRELPYIQMHYELSNGHTVYQPKHQLKSGIKTESGRCTTFYLPELDGYLYDPVCEDAISFEIELSEQWLKANLSDQSRSSDQFLKQVLNKEVTLLGNGSYFISPEMRQLIYEMNTCPYTGLVKQLFLEGKVLMLLGLQLHQIENAEKSNEIKIHKSDLERLYHLREMLTRDYAVKRSIEELAIHIGMNRTKLQAGFKQCFGVTIHDYLIEVRMNEAYKILRSAPKGSYNIVDIARHVGYKHYNHFSAIFKKRYGVSPSTFM